MGASRLVPVLLALLMVSPASTLPAPAAAQSDEAKPPDPYFTVSPGTGTTATVFTVDTRGSYVPNGTTVTLDWGDGNRTVNETGQLAHAYHRPGFYRITLTLEHDGESASSVAQVRVRDFAPPERANETGERIEKDDFQPNDVVELLQSAPMERSSVGTVVALVPGLETDAFPLSTDLANVSLDYVQCSAAGCTNETENVHEIEDPTGLSTAAFSVMMQKAVNADYYAVDVVPEDGEVDLDAITQALGFAEAVGADVAVSLLSPDAGFYDFPYTDLYEAYSQAAYPQAPGEPDRTELEPFLQGIVENRAEYDHGNRFRYNVPNGYNASRPVWFTGPADSAELRASHWDRMADGNDLGTKGPLAGAGETQRNGCAPLPQSIQYSDGKFHDLAEYQVYENATKLHQRLVPGDLAHLSPTQAQVVPRVAERLNERVCLELTLNMLARSGTAIVVPAGDNADHANVDDPSEADWDAQSVAGLAGLPQTITVGATTSYEPLNDGDEYGTTRVVSPYSAAGPARSLEGVKPDVLAPGDIPSIVPGNLSYEPAVVYDFTDEFQDNTTFGDTVRSSSLSIENETLHVDGAAEPTGVHWTGLRDLPPQPLVTGEVDVTSTPGDNRSATQHVFAIQKGTTLPPVSGFGLTFRAIGNETVRVEAHVWNATGGEYCAPGSLSCDVPSTEQFATDRQLNVSMEDTGLATLTGHRTVTFEITDGDTTVSLTRRVPVEGDDQVCACKHLTFLGRDDESGPTSGAVFDNATASGFGRKARAVYEPGVPVEVPGYDLGVRPSTRIAAAYVTAVLAVENQLLLTGETGPDRLQRLRGRLSQLAEPFPGVPVQVQGSGEINIENELKDSGLLPVREIEMTPDVGGVDMGNLPFQNESRYRVHHANGTVRTNLITSSHANVTFTEISDLNNSSLSADTDSLQWHRVIDTGRMEKANSDAPEIGFEAERRHGTWHARFSVDELPETPGVYATLVPIERSGDIQDLLFSENFTMPLTVTRTQSTTIDVSGTDLPEGASAWLLPPTEDDGDHLVYDPYLLAPGGHARVQNGQLSFGPRPAAAYSLSAATNASLPVPSEIGSNGIHDAGSQRDMAAVSSHLHPSASDPEALSSLDADASLPVPVAYRFLDIQQANNFTVGPIEEPPTPESGLENRRPSDPGVWNERGDPARGPGHALADPLPHGRTIEGWDIDLRSRAPPAGLGTSSSQATQDLYEERLDPASDAFNHTALTGFLDPRPYLADENRPYDPVHLGTSFALPQPADDVHGVLYLPLELEQAGGFVEISTDRRRVIRSLSEDSVWTPQSPGGNAWSFAKDPRDQLHDASRGGLLSGDDHQHPMGRTQFGPEDRRAGGYVIPYSLHEVPAGADEIEINVTVHPEPQSKVGRSLGRLPLDPLTGPRFNLEGAALYAWTNGRADRRGDRITGLDAGDPGRLADPDGSTPDPLEDPLFRVEPYHALGRAQGELMEVFVQGGDANLCVEADATVCAQGDPDSFNRSTRTIEPEDLRYPFGHAMGPVFYEDLDVAHEHEPYAHEVPRVHDVYPTEIRFRPTGDNVWRVDEDALQAAGGLSAISLDTGSFAAGDLERVEEPFPDAPDAAPPPGTVPNHCLVDTGYGTATTLTPYGKRFCFEDGTVYDPLRNASIPFGVERRIGIERDRVQDQQPFFEALDDTFALGQAKRGGCQQSGGDGFGCIGALLSAPTEVPDPQTVLPQGPEKPVWPVTHPGGIHQDDQVVWQKQNGSSSVVANGTLLWSGRASTNHSMVVLQSVFDTTDPNATGSVMISFPNTTLAPRILPTIEGETHLDPKVPDPADVGRVHAFNIGEFAPHDIRLTAVPNLDQGQWKVPNLRVVPLQTLLTMQGTEQPWGNWQGQLAPTCRVPAEDGSCMGPPVDVRRSSDGTQQARFLTVPSPGTLVEDILSDGSTSLNTSQPLWSGRVPHTDALLLVRHNFTDPQIDGSESAKLRLGMKGEGPAPGHVLATLEGVESFTPSDPSARPTRLDVFDLSGYQGSRATIQAEVQGNTTWNVHEARVVRAPPSPGPAPRDDPGLTQSDHPTVPAPALGGAPAGEQLRVGPAQLHKTDPGSEQTVAAPAGFTVDESTGNVTLEKIHLVLGGDVDQGARVHVTDGHNLTIEDAVVVPRDPAYRWGIRVDEGADLTLRNVTLMRGGHPRQAGAALDVAGDATLEDVRLLGGGTGVHVAPEGRLNATNTTIARFAVGASVEGTARLANAFVDGNLIGLAAREGVLAVRGGLFTSNRDGAVVTQDSAVAVENATFAWNGGGGHAAAVRTVEGLDNGHAVVHNASFHENTDAVRARASLELHDVRVRQDGGTAIHATPAAPVHASRLNASSSDAAVVVDAGGILTTNASYVRGATPIACTPAGEPATINLTSTRLDRIGPVDQPGLQPCDDANVETSPGQGATPETPDPSWRGIAARRFVQDKSPALVVPEHNLTDLEVLDASNGSLSVTLDQRDASLGELASEVTVSGAAPDAADDWIRYRATPSGDSGHRFASQHNLTVDRVPPTADIDVAATHVRGWTRATSMPVIVNATDEGSGRATTDLVASTLRPNLRRGFDDVTVLEGLRGGRAVLGHGSRANLPTVSGEETQLSARVTDRAGNEDTTVVESVKVDNTPPRAWIHADNPCGNLFGYDVRWHGHDPMRGSQLRYPANWAPSNNWSYDVSWAPLNVAWLGMALGLNLTDLLDLPADQALALIEDLATALGVQGTTTTTTATLNDALANQLGVGPPALDTGGLVPQLDLNLPLLAPPANPQVRNAMALERLDKAQGLTDVANETVNNATGLLLERWRSIGTFTRAQERVHLSPFVNLTDVVQDVERFAEEHPNLSKQKSQEVLENADEAVERLKRIKANRSRHVAEISLPSVLPNGTPVEERALLHKALGRPLETTEEDVQELLDLVNQTLADLLSLRPLVASVRVDARDAVGNMRSWQDPVIADAFAPTPLLYLLGDNVRERVVPLVMQPGATVDLKSLHTELSLMDPDCGLADVTLDLDLPASLNTSSVEKLYPRDGRVSIQIQDLLDIYPETVCGLQTPSVTARDVFGREKSLSVETILDRVPPVISGTTDLVGDVDSTGELPSGDEILGIVPLNGTAEDDYLELGTYDINLGVDTRVGDCDVGAPIHEVAVDAQIGQHAETTLFRTYYGPNVTGNVTVNENTSVSVQGSFDLTLDAFGLQPDDIVNQTVSVDVCATDEAGQVGCENLDDGPPKPDPVDPTPPVCGPDRLGLGNVPNPPTYQPVPKVPDLAGMGGREVPVNWSALDVDSGLRDPILLVRPQPIDENVSLPLLDNVTLPGNLSEKLNQTLLFVENQTEPWYTQQILLYELDQMLPDDPNGTLPLGDNLTDEIPIRDDGTVPFSYWSVLNESTSRYDLWRKAWGDKWPETDWYRERLNDSGIPIEMAGEGEVAHHNLTEDGNQQLPRWLEGPVWHPVQMACVVSDNAGNVNVTEPVNVTLDTELPFAEWLPALDPTDPSLNDTEPLTDQLYPIEADDLVPDPNNLSDPDHWFNRTPSIPLGVVEQVSGLQDLTVEAGVEGAGVQASEDLTGQVGATENDTPHARVNSTTAFQLDLQDLSQEDGVKWWLNLTVRDNVNNTWNDSMEITFDLTNPIAELCELTGNLVDGFLPIHLYNFEACVENAPSVGPYRSPLVEESVEMVLENASGGETTHPALDTEIQLDMDTSGPKNATLEACDVAGNCDRAELGFNADLDAPLTQLKSIPVDHVTTLLDNNRCLDSSAERFVGATVHWLNGTTQAVFNVTDLQPDADTSIAVEDRVSGVQGLTVWAQELDPDTLDPTGERVLVGDTDLGNDTWRPWKHVELNLSKLQERVPYNFQVSGYDRVGNEEPLTNLTNDLVAWDPVEPTTVLETLPEFSPDLEPSFVGNVTDDVDPTTPSFDACLDQIDARINASGTVSVEPHDIENASVGFDAALGNHSYEVNTSLDADTEGTQVEVCIRGRDRAANLGACSTTRATIPDLTPPEAFLEDLLDDLVGGGFLPVNELTDPANYSFDPLENNTGPGTQSPIANVTLTIDAPNGTTASYQLDAGQVESNASMTFEYGPTGTYAAAIHACDDVGHCQTPREATFDVDLTAPTTVLDRITSAIRNTTLQSGVEVHWVGGSIDASFNATDADGGTGPANLTVYAQPLAEGTLAENDTEASVEASKTDEGDLWATFDASFPSLDPDTIYRFEVNATDEAGNVEADPIDEPTPIDTHFAYDGSPPEVTLEPVDDYVGQLTITLTGNASDLAAGAESGLARLEVQATRENGSVDHENTTPTDTPEATDYELDYELDPADEGTAVDLCVRAEDAATNVGACSTTRNTTLDITPPDSSFDELPGELVDGFLNVSEHDDGTYSFSPTVANAGAENKSAVRNVTLEVRGPDGFRDVENLTAAELDADASMTFAYDGTGEYTATLTACDEVDNCEEAGQRAFLNFTVDLVPPNSTLETFTDGLLNQTEVNGTDVAWVDGHVTATFNVTDDGAGPASLNVTAQPVNESYEPNATAATPIVEKAATLLGETGSNATFEVAFSDLAAEQAYRFETNASDELGNTEANDTGPAPINETAWAWDDTLPETTLDEIAPYRNGTLVPIDGRASDVADGFESALANLTVDVETLDPTGLTTTDRDNVLVDGEETRYETTHDGGAADGSRLTYCTRATDRATQTGACSTEQTTVVDQTAPAVAVDPVTPVTDAGWVTQLPLEVNLTVTNTTPASGDLGSPVRRASLYATSADPADPGFNTTDLLREGVEIGPGQAHDMTVDVGAHDGYTYEVRGYAADEAGNRLHRGSADPSQPVNLTGEVAAYPLDGDATDATANTLDATVAGADVVEAGHHGQAYEFGEPGDAITVSSSPLVDDTTVTQRTVTAWVRVEDNATGEPQVVYDEGTATRGLNVYIADGRVHAGGWNTPSDESGWQGSWVSAPLSSDVDHHVGLVLDAGTTVEAGALELYVDGRLAGTADGSQLWPHASDTGLGSGAGDTRLPAGPTTADDLPLDGVVDDVRVFDTALTAAEVVERAVNPYEAYPETQRPAATTLSTDLTNPRSVPAPTDRFPLGDQVNVTVEDPTPGEVSSGVDRVQLEVLELDGSDYAVGRTLSPTNLSIAQADGVAIDAGDRAWVNRTVYNATYPVDVEIEVTEADTLSTSPDTSACSGTPATAGVLEWVVYLDGQLLASQDLTADGRGPANVTAGPVTLDAAATLTLGLEASGTWPDCLPDAAVRFDDLSVETAAGRPLVLDPMSSLDDYDQTVRDDGQHLSGFDAGAFDTTLASPPVAFDGADRADATAGLDTTSQPLERVDLPFVFPFYDRAPHGTAWVSETGAIALAPGFDNASTQANLENQTVIAPAWSDAFTTGHDAREVTIDTRRGDQVTIVWDVGTDADPSSQRRFAATLMRTGEVRFTYEDGLEPAEGEVDQVGVSDGLGTLGRVTELAPNATNLNGTQGLVPADGWTTLDEVESSVQSFQVPVPTDVPLRLRSTSEDAATNVEPSDPLAETETYVDTEPPIVDVSPVDGGGFPDHVLRVNASASDLGVGVESLELEVTNLSHPDQPTETFALDPGQNVTTNLSSYGIEHNARYGLDLTASDELAGLGFDDGFEDGTLDPWTTGGSNDLWRVGSDCRAASEGTRMLAFARPSPDCDYDAGDVNGWAATPALDVDHVDDVTLSFDHVFDLDQGSGEIARHDDVITSEGDHDDSGTLKRFTGVSASGDVRVTYRYCYVAGSDGTNAHIETFFDGAEVDDLAFKSPSTGAGTCESGDPSTFAERSFVVQAASISDEVRFDYDNGDWRVQIARILVEDADPPEDEIEVQVSSDDGASWQTVDRWDSDDGTNGDWTEQTYDLSAHASDAMKVRFLFDASSDTANDAAGWYVDDVDVTAGSGGGAIGQHVATASAEFTAQVLPVPEIDLERDLAGGVYVDDTLVGAGLDNATGKVLGDRLSVKGEVSADGEPVNLSFIHDGTKLDSTVDSFQDSVTFEEVIDVAGLDATEAHDIRLRSETPEGSWKTIDFAFELPNGSLVDNSSAEDSDSWEFANFSNGDTAGFSEEASRTGQRGVEIVSVSDSHHTPRANFSLSDAVTAGWHWAFVSLPQAPENGDLTLLKLAGEDGETLLGVRVDESMNILVKDESESWVATGATISTDTWRKIEVADRGGSVNLFLDHQFIGSWNKTKQSAVDELQFGAASPSVAGSMYVDDVGSSIHDPISRNRIIDLLKDTHGWDTQGDSQIIAQTDPSGKAKAVRVSSGQDGGSEAWIERSIQPTASRFWVTLNVGNFSDTGACTSEGFDLARVFDDQSKLVAQLKCDSDDGGLIALDGENGSIPIRSKGLVDETYNKLLLAFGPSGYEVFLNGEYAGTFAPGSYSAATKIRLGGGTGSAYFERVQFARGRIPQSESIESNLSRQQWNFEAPDGSLTAEAGTVSNKSGAFSGESYIQVTSDGSVNEQALALQNLSAPDTLRLSARIFVPESANYEVFAPLMLTDGEGQDVAGFAVTTSGTVESTHELSLRTGDTWTSAGTLTTGWQTISIELDMTTSPPEWKPFHNGDEITDSPLTPDSETLPAPRKIQVGDRYDDSTSDPGSGQGDMRLDGLDLHTLNHRPSVDIVSASQPDSEDIVTINGTVEDKDLADGVGLLEVRVRNATQWVEIGQIPMEPAWTYNWNTTGLPRDDTYKIKVNAFQEGDPATDTKTYTFE